MGYLLYFWLIMLPVIFGLSSARAYVLIPESCRVDQSKCLISGEMDYIFIYERIRSGDADFFVALDQQWPADKKLPVVWVESVGGSVQSAIKIGRILRKRHGIVATGNPIKRIDYSLCASACVVLAAGADERHLRHLGIHRPYRIEHEGKESEKLLPIPDEKLDDLRRYLTEMGMDKVLIDLTFNTPPEKIKNIVFDEENSSDQMITKLGFHMPPSDNFPTDGFPKMKNPFDQGQEDILEFAATSGSVDAAIDLSAYYESKTNVHLPSPDLARKWMEFAAEKGDIRAIHNLAAGLMSKNKRFGKRDIPKAMSLYKKAAEMGFGPSQNNLGWHYYVGKGLKKNIPLAIQLITSSALQGEPFAYGSLCQMYGDGGVFPKDNVAAYTWCDLALDQMPQGSGLKSALDAMTKITKNMTTADITEARQRASQWKPLKYPASVMEGDAD